MSKQIEATHDDLSDEELDSVAGGFGGILAAIYAAMTGADKLNDALEGTQKKPAEG